MDPRLTTDDDTNALFDQAVFWLKDYFGYSGEAAGALAREHYRLFRDAEYCRGAQVALHDDDMFHHQGAVDLALRIHYYMGLKADPDPRKYVEWRQDYYGKRLAARER